MTMENIHPSQKLVVALDIGTTKVCAIAGYRNEYDKIEVVGMGTDVSEGVTRGVVANIDKTVKAIRDAIQKAERQCKRKFKTVHVGIAGQHIKSLHHHGLLVRNDYNTEISEQDVDKLIKDMYKLVLPPGDKILHVIPQEFTVDDEQDILDPIGMSGIRLEANFHIITGQITASRNILKCVEKVGLEVADMTLEPIASASAVLSDEEKEAGIALVDIGGGTTDITIFKEGIIRHTAVIPFGGNMITKDIQEGCTVMLDQAEKLKVKFGSALADEIYDNRIITIPGLRGREPKEISEKNLARIIQSRVEEIFDFIYWEIQRSGYDKKLFGGLVLTGGGSLLNHINLLAEYHTGLPTRQGEPVEHLAHGYNGMLASPIYATAVGLLIHSINNIELEEQMNYYNGQAEGAEEGEENEEGGEKKSSKKILDTIFSYTKDFFEAKPDSEF